jgi:hypothetical protein
MWTVRHPLRRWISSSRYLRMRHSTWTDPRVPGLSDFEDNQTVLHSPLHHVRLRLVQRPLSCVACETGSGREKPNLTMVLASSICVYRVSLTAKPRFPQVWPFSISCFESFVVLAPSSPVEIRA